MTQQLKPWEGQRDKEKQRTFPTERLWYHSVSPGTLTKQRVVPEQIPKESKLAPIYSPLWMQRGKCSKEGEGKGCCNLNPREISCQAVSRMPVANHVFLGS